MNSFTTQGGSTNMNPIMIMWITKTGIFAPPRKIYSYNRIENHTTVITPDSAGIAAALAIAGSMLLGIGLAVALGNGC